ncbi:sugar ABC transporter substrate-binding protein [Ornithinimicrobium sufpigmenti]|uniref:sugar ABC transporter substrate-binding protein n=1 Tax=Ornithinimicrobium sufpigmenti TaxID=2508882 RepID=UPI00192E1263|nr:MULTISPECIES: substrate-binding domain-containing protein [unclassified Ornithinimicrobium]
MSITSLLIASCTQEAAPQEAAGSGDHSELVADMQALIDESSSQPEFTDPGPALDASELEGATIAVVAIDMNVPAIAEVTASVQEVAEQIGLQTTTFDGEGNPSMVNQGLSQAINNEVDAILSVGLVVDLISGQIGEAKDAGIPMVDVINSPPVPDVDGQGSDPQMFANVAPDSEHVGRLLGATAIVETEGEANVIIMNTSELTVAPAIVGGITEVLDQCEACEYTTTDTELVNWSTELQGQAGSAVRSDPDVNFVLPIYDAMTIFASSGIRQSGVRDVQMASFNGTAPALDLVLEGDIAVANIAQNNDWAAWAAVDQAMRGMLGMEPAHPVLPTRYLTTADLEAGSTASQEVANEANFGTGYREGYLELWGVK